MRKRFRRIVFVLVIASAGIFWVVKNPESYERVSQEVKGGFNQMVDIGGELASLESLKVKGRAPKTGYDRSKFYQAWPIIEGCSLRQRIIKRELGEKAIVDGCDVVGGEYIEPYNGELMKFSSKREISSKIQIDHVVALSDAWQKGAQEISAEQRYLIATDALNLLAVDGGANMQKGDADASSWLPKNKSFRCEYVSRQVRVKKKYNLWVTEAEKDAIRNVLLKCKK